MTQRRLVRLQLKPRSRPEAALQTLFGAADRVGLPVRPATAESAPLVALRSFAASLPLSGTLARRRILVVDNEPAATRLARLTLERAGLFDVCEVNDSLTALAIARRFQPHLVLLDLEMPGLDGPGVARLLREDPAFQHLPILFLTSLVTPEEASHHLYAAGSQVLAKPVTICKLMESVAEMLSNILHPGLPAASALLA